MISKGLHSFSVLSVGFGESFLSDSTVCGDCDTFSLLFIQYA